MHRRRDADVLLGVPCTGSVPPTTHPRLPRPPRPPPQAAVLATPMLSSFQDAFDEVGVRFDAVKASIDAFALAISFTSFHPVSRGPPGGEKEWSWNQGNGCMLSLPAVEV